MSIAARPATGVWGSRTTFVFALTASAIGLGNLWRFSTLLGEQGGAPFLITYLLCLLLVSAPLLLAEVMLGSHGRANPVGSLLYAARRSGLSKAWTVLGWLAGLTGFLVLGYHCVVAGWSLAYIELIQAGTFADASAADAGREFSDLLADPVAMVKWQSLFVAGVFAISALGVHRGLGPLFWLLGPLLLVAFAMLLGFALEYGNVQRAGEFLFSVNWYDFSARSVLIALSQAFYTLGVGAGVGLAFGAYAPEKTPLGRVVLAVALLDVVLAFAGGVVIFSLAFASNLEPAMGPSLFYVGLPYAFGNIAQGEWLGTLFFLTVSLISLASAIALAEPAMAYLVERMRLARPLSAALLGTATWAVAMVCALSFNVWQDATMAGDKSFFALLETVTTAILLPVVTLATALLVGYQMRPEILRVELYRESRKLVKFWRACLRYVVPPVIMLVMVTALFDRFSAA
ncbi:MAG: sodium-dependent transporter [Pseudomonadota bacterium]